MFNIDLNRYADDPTCATPEGLRTRMMAEIMPAIADNRIQRNRCLVATYVRPGKTAGGIIKPQNTVNEDRWQCKAGLLLAVGPIAFEYEEVLSYAGDLQSANTDLSWPDALAGAHAEYRIPQIGDWIMFRNSETHEVGIGILPGVAVSCRLITDDSIVSVVSDPSAIW